MQKIIRLIVSFIICTIAFGKPVYSQDSISEKQVQPKQQQHQITNNPQQELKPVQKVFGYDTLFSIGKGREEIEIYEKRKADNGDNYKFAIILFVMLAYVTWLTFTYRKELRENVTVLVNMGLGQQIYRDREFSASIFRLLTFTNFAVITGVGIYVAAIKFGVPLLFNALWFNIAAAVVFVMMAYVMKGIIYSIIGALYQINPVISFFRFNSLVIYQMLGIALFPLVIFAVFAPDPVNTWSLYAALAIFGIALCLRLIKGFSLLGMLKEFYILYFLLYICALEIAPVLILIRLFSMWS